MNVILCSMNLISCLISLIKTFVAIEISDKKKTINLFRKKSIDEQINKHFFSKEKFSLFKNLENVEKSFENKRCLAECANFEEYKFSY